MRSSKSASKLEKVIDQARSQAADVSGRMAPVVAEAKEMVGPAMSDARDRMAPTLAQAKDRLSDLTETVATKIDDALPEDRTPQAVQDASANSGGKFKKVLVVLGLGALGAFVASKLRGGSQPTWQSASPAAAPAPAPQPARTPTPAPTPADTAGGSPGEAASDAVETAHEPTTPDSPAEEVDLKE